MLYQMKRASLETRSRRADWGATIFFKRLIDAAADDSKNEGGEKQWERKDGGETKVRNEKLGN